MKELHDAMNTQQREEVLTTLYYHLTACDLSDELALTCDWSYNDKSSGYNLKLFSEFDNDIKELIDEWGYYDVAYSLASGFSDMTDNPDDIVLYSIDKSFGNIGIVTFTLYDLRISDINRWRIVDNVVEVLDIDTDEAWFALLNDYNYTDAARLCEDAFIAYHSLAEAARERSDD